MLRPLLARWMLIWMRYQSVRVADRVILSFLTHGAQVGHGGTPTPTTHQTGQRWSAARSLPVLAGCVQADEETHKAMHDHLSDDQARPHHHHSPTTLHSAKGGPTHKAFMFHVLLIGWCCE